MKDGLSLTPTAKQRYFDYAYQQLMCMAARSNSLIGISWHIALHLREPACDNTTFADNMALQLAMLVHTGADLFIPPTLLIPVLSQAVRQSKPARTQFLQQITALLLKLDIQGELTIPRSIRLFTLLRLSQSPSYTLNAVCELTKKSDATIATTLDHAIDILSDPKYRRRHALTHNTDFAATRVATINLS